MKKRLIKWALVLIWAAVIFIFSSQSGETSNENNRLLVEIFDRIGINLDTIMGGAADLVIRKLAHFTEFMILFILVHNALNDDFYFSPASLIAIVFTFLYAVTDEIHQSFVPNRGPAVLDVMIDTTGGLMGMGIMYLKQLISKRNRNRHIPYKYNDSRID